MFRHSTYCVPLKNLNQGLLHFWKKYSSSTMYHTAGIIVIGDEILKAQVRDSNCYYMCKILYNCGVQVKKVSIIGDVKQEISQEIREFSSKYTYVITSGGIGPTHDDVTYEGLAEAFDDSLHYHPTLVNIIKNQLGYQSANSPGLKMAYIPTKASLKFGQNGNATLTFPCVILNNVHVFPGSPVFFEKCFGSLCKELFSSKRTFFKDELYLNAREVSFANALTLVSTEFPNVVFGSYPENNNRYYKARITIESSDRAETMKAREKFCGLIPSDYLVEYDPNPQIDSVLKFEKFDQKHKNEIYKETLNELKIICQNPDAVVIYVDDSIETIAVLHLMWIIREKFHSKNTLQAVYLKNEQNSVTRREFIKKMVERYRVDIHILGDESTNQMENLRILKGKSEAIIICTRNVDDKENILNKIILNDTVEIFRIIQPLIKWTDDELRKFTTSLCL